MAHPMMFDREDPVLQRLRSICLGLPGADEKVSHGRPNFFTTKVFAIYGGSVKGDHSSGLHGRALLFLPDEADHAALFGDGRFFLPAYLGPSGWLGLDLPGDEVDWDEVAELVDASYRRTAPTRLVAALDASARP